VVYLDSVETSSTVRVISRVGLHMPIHATAAGKAMVSYDSDEELRKLFSGELPRYTKATRTDCDDLLKEIALVRERGYATDLEEFEVGLRCIGAPVRDYTRKVVGAISVSGPAHRLTDDRIATVVGPELARAGKALSARLGFRE
jgi:DNA-binding IclR family transcriptional regulator